jgi:hypothetical protein
MEQYFDLVLKFITDFRSWNPSSPIFYTVLSFGILSAWIMTRLVAVAPLFAGPISYGILTLAAFLSNFAFRGVVLMGMSEIQKALIFTVLGHALAGLLLLAVMKVNVKKIGS